MADKEEILELTDTDWVEIQVDPDADGYTEMIIQKKNINHGKIAWSLVNTLPDTVELPSPMIVNYTVYVKKIEARNNVELSIKRI